MSERWGALIVGGVEVPLHARLQVRQTYEPIGGWATLRMSSGRAVRQQHWRKVRTRIQGQGWMPAGLQDLDTSQPMTVACVAQRSLLSSDTTILLPEARRTDAGFEPKAFAQLNDEWVPTGIQITGNTASLDAVDGAERYRVDYYPEMMMFVDPPQDDLQLDEAQFGWEITAEEV